MIWTFWQGSEIENCASGPGFWILLRIVKKSPNFLKGIDTKFLYLYEYTNFYISRRYGLEQEVDVYLDSGYGYKYR
jgi:hypothetical protein